MKKIINGHIYVQNKNSLYIDGNMEYQAVNLISEYGSKLNDCKYALTSNHGQKKMEEMYADDIEKFRPYIFLTPEEYAPIRAYKNNGSKFHQRDINFHEGFDYQEEISESGHECVSLLADTEPDVLTLIIEAEEQAEMQKYIAALPAALASLTAKQRSRIVKHFYKGMTFREIAKAENADVSSVRDSISLAKENIKTFLKKI